MFSHTNLLTGLISYQLNSATIQALWIRRKPQEPQGSQENLFQWKSFGWEGTQDGDSGCHIKAFNDFSDLANPNCFLAKAADSHLLVDSDMLCKPHGFSS